MADLNDVSAMRAFQLNPNLAFWGRTYIKCPFFANRTIYFFFSLHTFPFLSIDWLTLYSKNKDLFQCVS